MQSWADDDRAAGFAQQPPSPPLGDRVAERVVVVGAWTMRGGYIYNSRVAASENPNGKENKKSGGEALAGWRRNATRHARKHTMVKARSVFAAIVVVGKSPAHVSINKVFHSHISRE